MRIGRAPWVVAGLALLALCVPVVRADESPQARALAYLEEIQKSSGAPGVSVAIGLGDRIVVSAGAGHADLDNLVPATGETVYNIGSVSKVVAAVAVMQLVERGEVSLDDPIRHFMPSFPEKRWPVTVRHVLTHTSGIRHYRDGDFRGDPVHDLNWIPYDSIEQAIEIFKDDPLLFEPGSYYLYSSYATNLLQGVVEAASGLGFEEYLDRHVFGPAGMESAGLDIATRIVRQRARGYRVEGASITNYPNEDVSYKFAGGGMIGSAEDLVRFGQALNRGELLEEATRELMWSPHVDPVRIFDPSGEPRVEDRWVLGLMWRLREDEAGRRYVYHAGTVKGFNAVLLNYRDEGLVVALLGNGHPVTPALRQAWHFAEIYFGALRGSR